MSNVKQYKQTMIKINHTHKVQTGRSITTVEDQKGQMMSLTYSIPISSRFKFENSDENTLMKRQNDKRKAGSPLINIKRNSGVIKDVEEQIYNKNKKI